MHAGVRVLIDGGDGAIPVGRLDAWLVTDQQTVARAGRRHDIKRLVFAHIGRPTLAALDRGLTPPFGEFARDGQMFRPGLRRRS